jgi:hypothetical protein
MLAILDPVWSRDVAISSTNKLLAILDVSSSMDVKDIDTQSRLDHARNALQVLRKGLPAGMSLKTLEFDTELRGTSPIFVGPPLAGAPGGSLKTR